MLRKILMKEDLFSSVKVCRVQPWHLNMSRNLCSSAASEERSDQTLKPSSSPKKDWFVYIEARQNGLFRLNLSQLCKRSSLKPVFEVVQDLREGPKGSSNNIPWNMQPLILGSKVYFVGGHIHTRSRRIHTRSLTNLDVYSFDPTESEGPSIRLCKEGPIPSLIPPKTKLECFPLVSHVEGKIYVLEAMPYRSQVGKDYVSEPIPPFFRVFDPLHQSWKLLPHPDLYDKSKGTFGFETFALGHKVYLCSNSYDSYAFDTHQEKWESIKNKTLDRGFKAVADLFKGFVIGVPPGEGEGEDEDELVVYRLDDNGILKTYQVLHELGGIFSPFLRARSCYMGECGGDGQMWFVYDGIVYDRYGSDSYFDLLCYMRVAVFRVSMSNDPAGNPVFSANLEAAEFYQLGCTGICSAFAMCHEHLKKPDIEEKDFDGRLLKPMPHAH